MRPEATSVCVLNACAFDAQSVGAVDLPLDAQQAATVATKLQRCSDVQYGKGALATQLG